MKKVEETFRKHARLAPLLLSITFLGTAGVSAQTSSSFSTNCSDPTQSSQPGCRSAQDSSQSAPIAIDQQQPSSYQIDSRRDQQGGSVYVDSAGIDSKRRIAQDLNFNDVFQPDPVTDLQRLARSATGEMLPIFGRDLFQKPPSTFAPADQIPAVPDYIVGPGDEVVLRLWGPESLNSQLTVDDSGAIYVPKVGAIHVAGSRFEDLQKIVSTALNHTYRNYNLSVNLGHLHSIQVYVVGEARRPGAYTISSLSTVLNALFVSGGPNVRGSLRNISVRREGHPATAFDLYDLVLRGDKSKDLRLQQGDTIFIADSGPQVALAGSVKHPAIYEVKNETTVDALLELAGGLSATAARQQLSIDRIDETNVRGALTVKLDAPGRLTPLKDGDVVFVNHIGLGYKDTVTIRGNLANAGRFPWHAGMKLSEIIPDQRSLLTSGYWKERNRLGVPSPLFEPLQQNNYFNPQRTPYQRSRTANGTNDQGSGSSQEQLYGQQGYQDQSGDQNNYQQNQQYPQNSQNPQTDANGVPLEAAVLNQGTQPATSAVPSFFGGIAAQNAPTTLQNPNDRYLNPGDIAPANDLQRDENKYQNYASTAPLTRIQIPAPEINWSYAVIERLDPTTLRTSLVPFNLGRLVQGHEASQDLELQPGDTVTILSQADVHVPQDELTKYVTLAGEFAGAGVYSVGPNETLDQLVARTGGFSVKAYLYGSSFIRQSARVFQQQRLNEYISTLSTDMEREAAVRTASSSTGILDPNALAEQRSLIAQLRQLRATGRVVLEFRPESVGVASIPKVPLENGDVFNVPSRPNTVSVVGSVYGQNVFLFDPKRRVTDYVALAGNPNRIADQKHSFIIRADGSIFSRERAKGVWSNTFLSTRINPGDAIVIPEKLIKPSALKQFIDFSTVLSSFGLAAAAINVVR